MGNDLKFWDKHKFALKPRSKLTTQFVKALTPDFKSQGATGETQTPYSKALTPSFKSLGG